MDNRRGSAGVPVDAAHKGDQAGDDGRQQVDARRSALPVVHRG